MSDNDSDDYPISSVWGTQAKDANDIYKGDGVNNCKWCGDTGWMHTFSNSGRFYNDAPCICKLGQKILDDRIKRKYAK